MGFEGCIFIRMQILASGFLRRAAAALDTVHAIGLCNVLCTPCRFIQYAERW